RRWHRQHASRDIHRAGAANQRPVAAGYQAHLPIGACCGEACDDVEQATLGAAEQSRWIQEEDPHARSSIHERVGKSIRRRHRAHWILASLASFASALDAAFILRSNSAK